MDVDFWASRINSVKHLSAVQADHHLVADDSDGDDDARSCFPCPFCYVDVEINVLCSHLENEHFFDLKNSVCPICAANLGKDIMGHFILQHTNSLKRRKRTLKSGLWSGSSVMLGKELSSFLGSSTNGRANTVELAPDLLLTPFLGIVKDSDPKGNQQDESSNKFSSISNLKSNEISNALDGGNEVDCEERSKRAAFVQQLVVSMIF
ncbi:hypothetical protein K2173_027454 [Erythroxylum novogranatense]|uniref:Uncharacterized protein n=1 Tax=Erythroxylum novogranatense TaxID=1862640 RepID=A0AAV8TZA1_9ROSI|nr:hypothetical protein K2173_027454 [Erythroxylum novogranatense]